MPGGGGLSAVREQERKAMERRDAVIRAAISEGVSMYRLSQLTGLSQPTIARIRDSA